MSLENPVCFSVWLVRGCYGLSVSGCYGLSVRGLRLVTVHSRFAMQKMILTPSQAGICIQTSREVLRLVGDVCIFAPVFVVFVPDSNTFATNPNVIGLVIRSVPVDHPH